MDSDGLENLYALKCIFNAHMGDVRVLKPTFIPNGGILTGSRDSTTKVWAPEGKSFKECNTFKATASFISSLCVLPPSTQYPKGLFLAGSNDCSIYGFTPDSSEPILRLLGHSGTVCTLSYGKGGFLISGSWDKTARVWSGQQCVLTLQGHLQAVWATDVFSTQNLILTGSADHTIRLWRSGICEKIFRGHMDCVRGLAILSDMKFLSCSNDTTVRLWLISGECLQVFQSHTDYIYSITLCNNLMDFATCGEDQSIKIWRNGACIQTIVLSSHSLWDVSCLTNGDLAVGTSDGKVYVFAKVPLDHFEKASEQSCSSQEAEKHTNENDSASTSGVSDLKSSIYCGEAIVTYQNESHFMYVCEYNNVGGTKVRKNVLDFQLIEEMFYKNPKTESEPTELSALNLAGTSQSRQYDYVFDVDVENTMYKLSFDKGDNPWAVASKFIEDHKLPLEYLSQIVEYIIKNTANSFSNEIYPVKIYQVYLTVNIEGLRAKLLEFCTQVPKEKYVSPFDVDELILLAYYPETVSHDQMSSLDKVISWSDEFLFPVLDLLRLAVQCKDVRSRVATKDFMNHLLRIYRYTNKNVNCVLVQKIFCNMFGSYETEELLISYQDKIFEAINEKIANGEMSIQKSAAALFLNFAIASYNGANVNLDSYCLATTDMLNCLIDSEAIHRLLVAVGTVCAHSPLAISSFKSFNLKEAILNFKTLSNKLERIVELLHSDFCFY